VEFASIAAFTLFLTPLHVAVPLLVLADPVTLESLMKVAATYLNMALQLLMGLAVLLFVWYVIQYFIRPADSKGHLEAAQYVLWSVIGFFVILSMWGIVNVLSATFWGSNAPSNAPTWGNIKNLFPQ